MGQLRLKPQLCRLQAVTQGKTRNVCESGPPHCDMVMGKKYTQVSVAVPGTQSGLLTSPLTLVMGKGGVRAQLHLIKVCDDLVEQP